MAETSLGTATVKIKATLDELDKGLSDAKGRVDKAALGIEARFKQIGDKAGRIGTAMTLGITLPIVGAGLASLKFAADAIESENLFEVSMKGMSDSAREFSETISKGLGLNAYEVRRQIGTWYLYAKGIGASDEAAFKMSKTLTILSADLSSFFNISQSDALMRLQSGMAGETEALRRLNIFISQARLETIALTQGWISQGQELTDTQKRLATYYAIIEDTKVAQGDLARTMDSPINAMRRLQTHVLALVISIGNKLMPVASAVLTWLANEGFPKLEDALGDAKLAWNDMGETGQRAVIAVAALLIGGGPLLKGIEMAINGIKLLGLAFGLLRAAAIPEIMAIGAGLELLGRMTAQAFAAVGAPFQETEAGLEIIGEQTDENAAALKAWANAYSPLGSIAGAAFGDLLDRLGTVGQAQGDVSETTENYKKVVAELIDGIYGDLPTLDQFQKGLSDTGDKAKEAADKLKEAGFSARDMAQAIAENHPAVQMLSLRIVGLNDQLAATNSAIEANVAAQRAIQDAISETQARISALNSQLSEARQRLSDLASPRLTGMGALDAQIFEAEQAIKRFQLLAAGGVLPEGIEMPTGTLTQWQRTLERLRLLWDVTYDPMIRQLQAAAEPLAPELSLAAALADIAATRAAIARLEGQVASATATLAAQQSELRGVQAEQDELRESAARLQAQIQLAEEQQRSMTKALVDAVVWMLEGSGKAKAYGGVVAEQAKVIDEKTKELLKTFFDFSDEHSGTTIADVNTAVAAWEAAKRRIDELAASIRVSAVGIGAPGIPSFARGGIVTRPTLAFVGESGPEAIVPLGAGGVGGSGGGINVTLQGDVILDGRKVGEVILRDLQGQRQSGRVLGLV